MSKAMSAQDLFEIVTDKYRSAKVKFEAIQRFGREKYARGKKSATTSQPF